MKLVIGYDGFPCARQAIADLAFAGLSAHESAKVVCVADVWLPAGAEAEQPQLPPPVARARALARQALDRALETAREGQRQLQELFPSWEVEAVSRADSPAWGLIQVADEWKADLLVVGSHGRSAVGRLVLGSVSQKVATEASCSVRVARQRPQPERQALRILVGFDGSPDAETALRAIATRAWPRDTEITLVAVMEPRSLSDLASEHSPLRSWVRPEDVEPRSAFERMLEHAAAQLSQNGLLVSSKLVEGDAKRALLEEEQRLSADCVFVGARGLNFYERFLLGSVSAAVAARAGCTVEIVRTQQTTR